jgi:hypothetical protein
MLAAPNRSRIRAVVEHAAQSGDSPPKWSLRLRLEAVEALYGGTFVHEGEVVEGFAFNLPEPPAPDDVLVAEAEYIGGPGGGTLQLHEPRLDPR